jgi:DNA polymerase V
MGASCGFPSPADDFAENSLDLNEYLIDHPASTFFVRAKGNSMIDAGILDGDLLIIDKSLDPKNNSIVLACIDGEFLIKKFVKKEGRTFLEACNSSFKNIDVTEKEGFSVEGLVVAVIHKL